MSLITNIMCTHSDDFMIVSKQPEMIMERLKEVYSIKLEGPPDYYLGNNYKKTKGMLGNRMQEVSGLRLSQEWSQCLVF